MSSDAKMSMASGFELILLLASSCSEILLLASGPDMLSACQLPSDLRCMVFHNVGIEEVEEVALVDDGKTIIIIITGIITIIIVIISV